MLRSVNPATGVVRAEYAPHDDAEIERRLALAWSAFGAWRERSLAERGRLVAAAADGLLGRRAPCARLITEEMGKPITQSLAEIDKCAWVLRHYAEHAPALLAPETIVADAASSCVRCDPLGPLLAVMPWNFPFWQVFRAAAPALMAGNVVLLKHASNVPGCALAIEELFRDAGFDAGCFTALLVGADKVDVLLDDDRIRAATLTGGESAGQRVAARAGARIKKTVLELGGSDPFIVLDDADPEAAAQAAAAARLVNSGQSCIAAKRFIVDDAIAASFTRTFTERMAGAKVGDPLDPATEVGPLARADLVSDLQRQVEQSVAQGARLLTGGRPLRRGGFFYAPTVLDEVAPAHPVAAEETFGPVAAVLAARGDESALALANQTSFGLAASVWSGSVERAQRLAARIEAGVVFVNGVVKSDPRLPFGGVKRSGYGRELGREGIREFVNLKTVVVP